MIDTPTLSEENSDEFVKMYENAVDKGEPSFTFYGQEILVEFAKYLLEYHNLKINFKNNL